MTDTNESLTAAVAELVAELKSAREPPVLLDADGAAKLLSLGTSTFYRAVSAGELPKAIHSPGGPRWKRADLMKAVEKMRPRRKRTAAEK